MLLTKEEEFLIEYIRNLGWGNIEILIQNSSPIIIKKSIKSIKIKEEIKERVDNR